MLSMNSMKLNRPEAMSQCLFDLEATGLLRCGSTIHCLVIRDVDTPTGHALYDHRQSHHLDVGISRLEAAELLIGHHIIGYDIPLSKEQPASFNPSGQVLDTLVLSRLFYPHLVDRDYERRPDGMPAKLYGRHSLEAWGYRLKCHKGSFATAGGVWDKYTPEMASYCVQDTEVTLKLFQLMQRRINEHT